MGANDLKLSSIWILSIKRAKLKEYSLHKMLFYMHADSITEVSLPLVSEDLIKCIQSRQSEIIENCMTLKSVAYFYVQ